MSNQIKVKDMVVGKCYKQSNKIYGKLVESTITSYGGSGYNEPQYKLVFEDGQSYIKEWCICFEELYICPFPQKYEKKSNSVWD
jgi:3-deoxy-D-arabino-heptulosonate 7-phosphate (DAHP) synthase